MKNILQFVATPIILTGKGIFSTGRGLKVVGQKVEDAGAAVMAKGGQMLLDCKLQAMEEAETARLNKIAKVEAQLAALRGPSATATPARETEEHVCSDFDRQMAVA